MEEKFDKTNKGAVWKNRYKTKDGQPDFTGGKGAGFFLKIENGLSNWKDEVLVEDVASLVTYDKDGNPYPFFIKNGEGKVTGIQLCMNMKSWKRREGGSDGAPVLTFQAEPNVNSGNENQIPFSKEEVKNDNISDEDIPF